MIQMVASDIDGTLLRGSMTEIPPEVFDCVRALRKRGILFCASSGRQYTSQRRLLAPVADEIIFSCENGAIVYHKDAVLAKTAVDPSHAKQLIGQIHAQPGCHVLISGADTSYVLQGCEAFGQSMAEEAGNNVQVVASMEAIAEPIIKVSAWCETKAADYEPLFSPVWSKHLNVAIAGHQWLDFTLSHKGTALAQISASFGIPATDILVFGDNFNDIPMFRFAGQAYAMANAAAPVQQAAHGLCEDVPTTLRSLGLV